jgi:BirA family biotin operon repressor/biotin-[acetyl-CoA-carboxylase] ligase
LWCRAKTDYGDVVHTEQYRSPLFPAGSPGSPLLTGPDAPVVQEWPPEQTSTNTRLAELLESGVRIPDFAAVGTDHQVNGQGRLGRSWTVPAGAALTFSVPVALPQDTDLAGLGWIPVVTGLAVTRALAGLGVAARIKWPNDVLTPDGRKLCGILSRLVLRPDGGRSVVVGAGVNVSLTEEELPVETASSVLLEGGDPDRAALLVGILSQLPGLVREVLAAGTGFSRSEAAAEVRAAMATLGSHVRVHLPGDTSFTGIAVDLDDEANLLVRDDSAPASAEPVRVSAGDVVHVRPA